MAPARVGDQQPGNMIRSSWNAGKKKVVIDGVEYTIVKLTKLVQFTTVDRDTERKSGPIPTKTNKRVESWLVAKPTDRHTRGSVFSVEAVPGRNMRTAT